MHPGRLYCARLPPRRAAGRCRDRRCARRRRTACPGQVRRPGGEVRWLLRRSPGSRDRRECCSGPGRLGLFHSTDRRLRFAVVRGGLRPKRHRRVRLRRPYCGVGRLRAPSPAGGRRTGSFIAGERFGIWVRPGEPRLRISGSVGKGFLLGLVGPLRPVPPADGVRLSGGIRIPARRRVAHGFTVTSARVNQAVDSGRQAPSS
jgi:hypothetical protein